MVIKFLRFNTLFPDILRRGLGDSWLKKILLIGSFVLILDHDVLISGLRLHEILDESQ